MAPASARAAAAPATGAQVPAPWTDGGVLGTPLPRRESVFVNRFICEIWGYFWIRVDGGGDGIKGSYGWTKDMNLNEGRWTAEGGDYREGGERASS